MNTGNRGPILPGVSTDRRSHMFTSIAALFYSRTKEEAANREEEREGGGEESSRKKRSR